MAKTPKIAIVDDDASVRASTVDLLEALGFDAVDYSSAAEFLHSNALHSTSCLITDVQMPGMSGFELHDRLVEARNLIPTILITAYPVDCDRLRALQAGVVCYLTKPFNHDELLACVRSIVNTTDSRKR